MPFKPKASRFYHYDFQIRGRRFHGSCGTEDFEEAKAIEAEARVRAKTGDHSKGRFTISEALGTYWQDVCSHQPSAKTSSSQAAAILAVIAPKTRLDQLRNSDIMRFARIRRATVSNATVNRQIQFLGRAIRHMERIHRAEVAELDLKAAITKEPSERVRELSTDEQSRLLKHLRADLQPLVKFALMTGARQGSIIGLKWRDVDFAASRITFRLKGGKAMRFPMNREIRALLSAMPKSNVVETRAFVFTYLGEDGERRRIRKNGHVFGDFREALRLAEIEDFRFHDLRHTFATRMLRATGNLKLVSRLLGHESIETTMRYAHVLDDDLASAMENFSALSDGESRDFSRSSISRSGGGKMHKKPRPLGPGQLR